MSGIYSRHLKKWLTCPNCGSDHFNNSDCGELEIKRDGVIFHEVERFYCLQCGTVIVVLYNEDKREYIEYVM